MTASGDVPMVPVEEEATQGSYAGEGEPGHGAGDGRAVAPGSAFLASQQPANESKLGLLSARSVTHNEAQPIKVEVLGLPEHNVQPESPLAIAKVRMRVAGMAGALRRETRFGIRLSI